MADHQQQDTYDKNQKPKRRRSYAKVWCLVVAIGFYGISQLDISALNISTLSLNSLGTTLHSDNKKPILQISVLGERNSGTRWTWSHLTECFNHSIPVKTKLTRYKHWFQFPAFGRYPHDTLVIEQFRNPYDWLKATQHVPHHAPDHVKYRSDDKWKGFLTAPWTMERVGTDKWDNYTICQEHFHRHEIVSCPVEPLPKSAYKSLTYSNHQPFYELRNDGSGKPYDNIMEMRSDKIRNFLSVRDYEGVADVWVVQYEYLLTKGTQELIQQISDWTGVEPKCKPKPPQQRRSRPIERDMAEYIREHLNWTAEALVGYAPHVDGLGKVGRFIAGVGN